MTVKYDACLKCENHTADCHSNCLEYQSFWLLNELENVKKSKKNKAEETHRAIRYKHLKKPFPQPID